MKSQKKHPSILNQSHIQMLLSTHLCKASTLSKVFIAIQQTYQGPVGVKRPLRNALKLALR